MSEVYELCKMLDERGAKWYERGGAVFWETHDGAFRYMALPHEEALKVMTCCSQRFTVMTAAQAIEATLGRRKCKNVHEPPKDTTFWPAPHFKCSVCGKTHVSMDYVYFCPNCGAEVVDA